MPRLKAGHPLGDLLASSEEKDEAPIKAAAWACRGVSANFRFLRGVEIPRLRGRLGRNVERNWGVWIDPQVSGLGKQVACRTIN